MGQSSTSPPDAASVRALVDSVAREHVGPDAIPGAAITVVRDTSVVVAEGYGVADAASGRRVDPAHTLFRIGSITKLFTATAALQAVEKGRLDLHTDVNQYLDGTVVPNRFDAPVTLHHLLTHTAGFEDRFMGTTAYEVSSIKPLGTYLENDLPQRVRPPGQVASYSNHGLTLAGHLAAEAADTTYADLVRERIFSPLGMDRSAASLPALPDSLRAAVATPYHRTDGSLVPHPRTYYQIAPAGGALATTTDMAQFLIAHLNEGRGAGGRILQSTTTRQMHRQQFTHDPSLPGWTYGFQEHPRASPRVLMHGGGARGFTALLWIVPERDLGVFVVCNLPDDTLQTALLETVNERFFPSSDKAPPPVSDQPNPMTASALTGHYRHVRHAQSTIEKALALSMHAVVTETDSGLVVDGIAPEPIRLRPLGNGRFQRSDGGTVVFDEKRDGEFSFLYVGAPTAPAYQRVSAWTSPTVQGVLVGGFALVFFLSVIGVGVGWWREGARPVREEWVAAGIGGAYLVFFIGFPLALLEGPSGHMLAFFYGPSPTLVVVLVLPLIALVATAYLAVRVGRAWWKRTDSVWRRIGRTVVVLASGTCGLLLHYWNLLGWQF